VSQPLVIFDFDGVLVDSEVLSNQVLSFVLTELGYPVTPDESHARFIGMKMRRVRETVEQDWGRQLPDRFEHMLHQQAHERMVPEIQAVRGAPALLDGFTHPRCIASNSNHTWIRMALDATAMRHHFEDRALFSAADVAEGKPAPDLFLHAADRMGTTPESCIVVEDSRHGVVAARAAGMQVLGFDGGRHCAPGHADTLRAAGADTIFSDMRELADVLERLA